MADVSQPTWGHKQTSEIKVFGAVLLKCIFILQEKPGSAALLKFQKYYVPRIRLAEAAALDVSGEVSDPSSRQHPLVTVTSLLLDKLFLVFISCNEFPDSLTQYENSFPIQTLVSAHK